MNEMNNTVRQTSLTQLNFKHLFKHLAGFNRGAIIYVCTCADNSYIVYAIYCICAVEAYVFILYRKTRNIHLVKAYAQELVVRQNYNKNSCVLVLLI